MDFFIISKSAMARHNAIRGDKTVRIPLALLADMDFAVVYDEHSFVVKKDRSGGSYTEQEHPIEELPAWIKQRSDYKRTEG